MTLVFVYGTLRDPARLAHIFGHGFSSTALADRYLGPASARDRRVVVGTNGFLTVVDEAGATAEGELVELRGADELEAIDWFEGVRDGFYERATLELKDGRSALYWRQTSAYAPVLVRGVYKPPPRR